MANRHRELFWGGYELNTQPNMFLILGTFYCEALSSLKLKFRGTSRKIKVAEKQANASEVGALMNSAHSVHEVGANITDGSVVKIGLASFGTAEMDVIIDVNN